MNTVSHYTVETTKARIHTTASSPEAAAVIVQAVERCPRSAILRVTATRLHFVEITHYQNPPRRAFFIHEEEAAAAYAEAVDEVDFYEDVAQVRQGIQQGKARRITRRHTNL
jgi:hypothetical protein